MAEDHRYRAQLSVVVICSPRQRFVTSIYRGLEDIGVPVSVVAVHASLGEFIAAERQSGCRQIDLIAVAHASDDDDAEIEALRRVCAAGHRVICFGDSLRYDTIMRCLGAGAVAFVVGDRHPSGYAAVTMRTASELKIPASNATSVSSPGLTQRESEVLIAWCHASTKEEVADQLNIERATVSAHLQRIRAKYAAVGRAANTKAGLIARAVQDGLVDVYEL